MPAPIITKSNNKTTKNEATNLAQALRIFTIQVYKYTHTLILNIRILTIQVYKYTHTLILSIQVYTYSHT